MKEEPLSSWEQFEEKKEALFEDRKRMRGGQRRTSVSDLLFRGQSKACWGLRTTLERATKSVLSFRDYYRIMRAVKPIVEPLTQAHWDLGAENEIDDPMPKPPPGYPFMAYLRHHGFPSPILDWSRSPYIAAFFAFRQKPSPGCDQVAIYAYLEYCGEGKTWAADEAHLVGLGPSISTDLRHYHQQSEYTVCRKQVDGRLFYWNHEDVLQRSDDEQDLLIKYVIPASERPKVLERLVTMNIHAHSLFGDEDSLMEKLAYEEIERRAL